MLVRGVVTVGPGWILGESTVAIQDDSGGIYVRVIEPDIDLIVPGRVLQVGGVLADPFGNLELRPEAVDVEILEMAAIPPARTLTTGELNETTEGILAIVTGTISSVDASSTGSVTIMFEDTTGEGRVFGHATLAMSRADYPVGSRISAIGLVGDRLGLYRLWPRNKFDVASLPDDPTPTPSPTLDPLARADQDADTYPDVSTDSDSNCPTDRDPNRDRHGQQQPDHRHRGRAAPPGS